ncbi:MAG: class I SAM-dependent methyltransferase [Defluviitaleaceae bacterium]|nr:class I SAM-dependent methyltransferase [Defluviitaleaceae bacterium]
MIIDDNKYYDEYKYLYPCLADKIENGFGNASNHILDWIRNSKVQNVLDLGCGTGHFREFIKKHTSGVNYKGIDIYSDENIKDQSWFSVFNGIEIPCKQNSQNMIITKQVLEHVRQPYELLCSVSRSLTDDGMFVGTCSGLEPQHTNSCFNFTPFGLKLIFEKSGLELIQLKSGITCDNLISWHQHIYLKKRIEFSYEKSNFIKKIIEESLKNGISEKYINYICCIFAGHLLFAAKKIK